jgi:hypothetical protein
MTGNVFVVLSSSFTDCIVRCFQFGADPLMVYTPTNVRNSFHLNLKLHVLSGQLK